MNWGAGYTLPFMAILHDYRSYADMVQNNAASHKTWVEEGHSDTEEIEKILGFPSPQFAILDSLLQSYAARLCALLKWIKGPEDVSETTRRLWLTQDLMSATGFYKAFAPIEAHLSDRLI